MSFVLSVDQEAHKEDVKCICILPSSDSLLYFMTGSRDHSVKLWCLVPLSVSVHLVQTYRHHQGYVNAVGFLPMKGGLQWGWMLSSGSDKVIYAWAPPSAAELPRVDESGKLVHPVQETSIEEMPTYALIGHEENVCCLSVTPQGKIISGSWDKTVRVWEDWNCIYVLKGHTAAVWAVSCLDNGTILSGSADKTIRMWSKDTCIAVLSGHADAVRQLCLLPMGGGFASCSNDNAVHIWSDSGHFISKFGDPGHSSFIYTITGSFGDPMQADKPHFATAGEDGQIILWRDKVSIQNIAYPSTSIWAMASVSLKSGASLLLVAGSDGHVRVFTDDPRMMASEEEKRGYVDEIQNKRSKRSKVDKTKLPGPEALKTQIGTRQGAILMVKQPGKEERVEAYQWDMETRSWIHVGQVMDDEEDSSDRMVDGKLYDHVFQIELDGKMMSLPYMKGENPFSAAHAFIEKNELPIYYLDQITNFISKNSGGSTVTEEKKDWTLLKTVNREGILKKIRAFNAELPCVLTETELSEIEKSISDGTCNKDVLESVIKKMKKWPKDRLFPFLDCLRLWVLEESEILVCIGQDVVPGFLFSVFQGCEDQTVLTRNANLAGRCMVNLFATRAGRDLIAEKTKDILDIYAVMKKHGTDAQCLEGFANNFSLLTESSSDLLSWIEKLAE